jgi:gliding motility-associated-like protein
MPMGNGLNVQLKSDGFAYDTYKSIGKPVDLSTRKPDQERPTPPSQHFHRVDIDFVGANPDATIETGPAEPDVLHFYKEIITTDVRHFRRVVYRNIWPDIDVEFLAVADTSKPVEYNFIVHPGADINLIQLRYKGTDRAELVGGALQLTVAHGQLTEKIPAAWQLGDRTPVSVAYRLIESAEGSCTIGFRSDISTSKGLIIDPTPNLSWGTYYGGVGEDTGRAIAVDSINGNNFSIGNTNMSPNLATAGTYQTINAGDNDVLLVKLNSDGVRQWATYYGGDCADSGQSVALDGTGNVYCAGYTCSANLGTAGTHQPVYAGEDDVFLVKFNPNGQRIWGTYYGGFFQDYGNHVSVDAAGNAVVTGWTRSTNGIASPGAFQGTNQGQSDVFLAFFTPAGARQWGTYLGGPEFEIGLATTIVNNIINCSGWTSSTTNIASPGAFQTVYGGGTADMFLAQFTTAGVRNWCTYYGGSLEEYGDVLASRTNGDIIMGGPGRSTGLGTPGTHQPVSGGDFEAILAKFTSTGNRVWGTYYGGPSVETGYGLALTNTHIYFSGSTSSTSGISTSMAYQTVPGGNLDAFVAKLNDSNGTRVWGTYYGGPADDWGFQIGIDSNEDIYLVGTTASNAGISTAGAHQVAYGSGVSDMMIAKFAPCGPLTASIPNAGYLCDNAPFVLQFDFSEGGNYSINYAVDGVPQTTPISNNGQNPFFWNYTGPWQDSVEILSINRDGCPVTITSLYDFVEVIAPVSATPPQFTCNAAGTTYTLTTTLSGGVFDYVPIPIGSGFINPSNFFTSNPIPSGQPFNIGFYSGVFCDTFYIIGTHTCPCSSPTITIQTPNPVCPGGTATLTASGAQTYVWSGGITNGVAFTPSQTMTYTVTATGANACTATAAATVVVNQAPIVTIQNDSPTICNGGTASITATGGQSFAWSNGVNTNGFTFTPTTTQTYTVTATAPNGCTATATTIVAVNTAPIIAIQNPNPVVCNGGTATLTASGAQTYAWSGGITNGVAFTPTQTQTYTVTATAANGCTVVATATVTVGQAPTINIQNPNPTVCSGGSATLTASGAQTYAWSGGITNGVAFSPTQTLTYTVTATTANGCTATATATVTVNPALNITIQNLNPTVCQTSPATLTASGAQTYAWSGGITNGIAFTPTQTQTYTVTATAANGCTATATATITVTPIPTGQINVSAFSLCTGEQLTLSATSGGNSFDWVGTPLGGGANFNVQSGVPFVPPGSANYTVVITGANNCTGTTTITVTVLPTPIVTIQNTNPTVCSGGSATLTASGAQSYVWSGGITNGVAFTATQMQTYTVTATAANSCTATATTTVNISPPLNPSVVASAIALCSGDQLTLTASGGNTYTWIGTPAGGGVNFNVQNGVAFEPPSTATYTVTVTAANNCTGTATITIPVNQVPDATINGPDTICAGSTITLSTQAVGTYEWSSGETTNSITIKPSLSTTYEVTVSNAGCVGSASWAIFIRPVPTVSVVAGANSSAGTLLEASGAISYTWSPPTALSCTDCANPTASPAAQTNYCVIGTDANGCTNTACVDVRPAPACAYYLPNALTVNGSDPNRRFCIYNSGCVASATIRIFDRWGTMIWESTGANNCWDGTYRGQDLQPGVYIYWVEVTTNQGKIIQEKGDITIID